VLFGVSPIDPVSLAGASRPRIDPVASLRAD
jgi:hypothetical protein